MFLFRIAWKKAGKWVAGGLASAVAVDILTDHILPELLKDLDENNDQICFWNDRKVIYCFSISNNGSYHIQN